MSIELEQGRAIIDRGIAKLRANKFSEFGVEEYMEIYRTVYKLCTQKAPHNYPQEVYDKYRKSLEEYMGSQVFPAGDGDGDGDDESMLTRDVVKFCENYKLMHRFLSNMFYYLDRYFVRKQSLPALREVGITLFRERAYLKVRVILKNEVIALINREREGEEIDRALLKTLVNIFLENGIDLYEKDLEVPMLEETGTYYSRKSAFWISEAQLSSAEYMLKAEECLNREMDIVTEYLHSSSEHKLLERVQNELLSSRNTHLVENEHSGCAVLFRDDKKEDLSRMYRLFSRIPPESHALESLANAFQQYVTTQGISLINDVHDAGATAALDKLIQLHELSEVYAMGVFQNNHIFQNASTEAFRVICNKRIAGLKSADFFATFFDKLLKKAAACNDSEDRLLLSLTGAVEKAGTLLRYLDEKDLFQEFFTRKQANRLLFDRCPIADNERTLVSKVRAELGYGMAAQAQEMLEDYFVKATGIQAEFKQYLDRSSNTLTDLDLAVTALSGGDWPPYQSCQQLNLPCREMAQSVELFTAFFSEKNPNRKLTWMYSLGTCNITVNFDQNPIEITASTYQGAVILLFNDAARFSYEEIKARLNLGDEELASVLHSLACTEEYKILLKEPDTRTIASTDHFRLNSKFTHTENKIQLPAFRRPERPEDGLDQQEEEEMQAVIEYVEEQRPYLILCALVRIMKRARVLPLPQLLSACIEELSDKFRPSEQMMKAQINKLAEVFFIFEIVGREALFKEGEEGAGSEIIKYLPNQQEIERDNANAKKD